MPNWIEKILLSPKKIAILETIEMFDIRRQHNVYPGEEFVYIACNENDDSRIVKVKRTFDKDKRPVDLIAWGMYRDAQTGKTVSLNEANNRFAKLAYNKIYKKYTNQR